LLGSRGRSAFPIAYLQHHNICLCDVSNTQKFKKTARNSNENWCFRHKQTNKQVSSTVAWASSKGGEKEKEKEKKKRERDINILGQKCLTAC
jgi:hypothetical protein